jgi:hypothetical protein
MQHGSVDYPPSHRPHKPGMWNAIKVAADIRIYNLPMASVDQLVDMAHCVQRAAVCPIGILLRLQVGFENRFEHQHCRCLHNPIPDCWYPTASASRPALGCKPAAQVAVDRFGFSVLASVRPTTVPNRAVRCPRMSVCPLPLLRRWLCNVHRHMPERPSDTPCHTARRNEGRAIPSLLRVTPSATSERLLGLLGSSTIPRSFVAYYVRLQLRPLPSTGITRLHRYYKPLRHPRRPGLSLASSQLIQLQSPLGLPVLPSVPFACMPSPLPRQVGRKLFARNLPPHRPSPSPRRVGTCIMVFEACSAFTHVTACTLAESSSRPSYIGGFSSFVASTAAPIATEWNEPVPGWDLHPLWTKRLFTAHADHPISYAEGEQTESKSMARRNMSIDQLKSVVLDQQVDPLNDFALKCRSELRTVYARASWERAWVY